MTSRLPTIVAVAGLCLSSWAGAAGFNWSGAPATGDTPLLKATQAFEMQAPRWDGKDVELSWTIAPGYYLYRDRIQVQAPAGAPAGKLDLPAAQEHDDPAFGRVAIYRDRLTARYIPTTPGARRLEITVQGCADRGVCYPPLTRAVSLPAPPASR